MYPFRSLLLCFCLSLSVAALGQSAVDSRRVLEQGMEEYDKGNYKQALQLYASIPPSDTNYIQVVFEKAQTLFADSQYNAALKEAQLGLSYPYIDKRRFRLLLANIYNYMGQLRKAGVFYDSIAHWYPHDPQPPYERGVYFFSRLQFAPAMQYLQQALLMQPYQYRAHYMLGLCYLSLGRFSEALMALQAVLLTTNNVDISRNASDIMKLIAVQSAEVHMYSSISHTSSFSAIDSAIAARLVLSSQYKSLPGIDDTVDKVTYLLSDRLSFVPADTTFAMQYYVPLLTQLRRLGMQDMYLLYAYDVFNKLRVNQQSYTNKDKYEAAGKVIYAYMDSIRSTRVLQYGRRKATRPQYHYLSDNQLIQGYFKDAANGIYDSGIVAIYDQENLAATGAYNTNNHRHGIWKTYYPSGTLRQVANYTDDTPTGTHEQYSYKGILTRRTHYSPTGEQLSLEEFDETGKPLKK
jgi:uncharacterized protein